MVETSGQGSLHQNYKKSHSHSSQSPKFRRYSQNVISRDFHVIKAFNKAYTHKILTTYFINTYRHVAQIFQ